MPINPKGWRRRYIFKAQKKMQSLGVFLEVSLKDARERRDEARRLLANGIDPNKNRKAPGINDDEPTTRMPALR
ncbi:MAG: putative prophage integrase [Pseudomonadota bacterium]|jgi:hypothetical protein